NQADAATQFDLVTTALHEFAHGLGQLNYLDLTTGAPLLDALDMYSTFLFDNTAGKSWGEMTNVERASSARNFGNVVWHGAWVDREAPSFLIHRAVLDVQSPPPIAGSYEIGTAHFGGAISLTPLVGELVLADDQNGAPSDACEP